MRDGQPSWTLHDPARNQFFQLDWLSFEILSRWSLGNPDLIAEKISQQSPLNPCANDVVDVLDFLGKNQLLHLVGVGQSKAWSDAIAKRNSSVWRSVLSNYLFFRVPLVKPQAFLERVSGSLSFLFAKGFWWLSGLALLFGVFTIMRQWDVFASTFFEMNTPSGWVSYVVTLIAVKVVHELGHGLVAVRHGCKVPRMGIAFVVLTPLAYTDTTEAWKLSAKAPRLWIGAAGMMAELLLAVWSTVAWAFLPDGPLRTAAFLVCSVTWVKSLLVNLSPVMRFDGYFLLSDALNLPNLHARSFAMSRWKLREWLFTWGREPEERMSPAMTRLLVALGFFIWVYRLFLFLGIAFFVYQFFFKALGIVLFAVEILFFLALPIWSELRFWWSERAAVAKSRRARWIFGILFTSVLILSIPHSRRVKMSGRLFPHQTWNIYVPEASTVVELPLKDGEKVPEGGALFRLVSPELEHQLALVKVKEGSVAAKRAAALVNQELSSKIPLLDAELSSLAAQRNEMEASLSRLSPVSPFAGTFRSMQPDLREGEMVAKGDWLGVLFDPDDWLVEAYVPESERHLLREGAKARFTPEGSLGPVMDLWVRSVELDATRELGQEMLASVYGGSVRARYSQEKLIPETAVYRVVFKIEGFQDTSLDRIRRGRVVVYADSESILVGMWKQFLSVLWRELGF